MHPSWQKGFAAKPANVISSCLLKFLMQLEINNWFRDWKILLCYLMKKGWIILGCIIELSEGALSPSRDFGFALSLSLSLSPEWNSRKFFVCRRRRRLRPWRRDVDGGDWRTNCPAVSRIWRPFFEIWNSYCKMQHSNSNFPSTLQFATGL